MEVEKIDIPVDPEESLALMQKCIESDIEVIHRHADKVYLGHEEGRLLKLPRNPFFVEHFYGDFE